MAANEYFLHHFENFNRDGKVWRYLTTEKFQQLLSDQAIWFSRVDKFDDAFEGALSEATRAIVKYPPDVSLETIERLKKIHLWQRQWTFATCWHYANHENALMWAAYAPDGVAIQTTFSKLAGQLPLNVMLSPVMYKDFDNEVVTDGTHVRYLAKRHFFKAEREVRGVFVDWPSIPQESDGGPDNPDPGRSIEVDLNDLIEAVVVRPYASAEEVAQITRMVQSAGLNIPVKASALSGTPRLN